MHPNEKLIETFYTAFKSSDPEGMIACYHPDIEFSDPVFPGLRGRRARAMWAMLGERKADPNDRTFRDVRADDHRGSAHWEAKYKFPLNGRPVHNIIDAEFEFEDGKIRKHTDTFDFWRWSRQALGAPGILLGWGPLKGPLRKKLAARLDEFMEKHPEIT
jgi:ketosteroid isomerase-like protein